MTFHKWKFDLALFPKHRDRGRSRAARGEASATVTNLAVEEDMEIEDEENIEPQ